MSILSPDLIKRSEVVTIKGSRGTLFRLPTSPTVKVPNIKNVGKTIKPITPIIRVNKSPAREVVEEPASPETPTPPPSVTRLTTRVDTPKYTRVPVVTPRAIETVTLVPQGIIPFPQPSQVAAPVVETKVDGVVQSIPNYQAMPPEEQQRHRDEFVVKFNILKTNFRDWSITDPPADLPLERVHQLYDEYVKKIVIASNCSGYKRNMFLALLAFEFACIHYGKIDLGGYAMAQMRSMHKYDQLFTELGEKWYVQGGTGWPIEVRICLTVAFNALIFFGVKAMMKKMGKENSTDMIMDAIDKITAINPTPITSAVPGGAVPPAPETVQDPILNIIGGLTGGGGGIGDIVGMFGNMFGGLKNKGGGEKPQKKREPTDW